MGFHLCIYYKLVQQHSVAKGGLHEFQCLCLDYLGRMNFTKQKIAYCRRITALAVCGNVPCIWPGLVNDADDADDAWQY